MEEEVTGGWDGEGRGEKMGRHVSRCILRVEGGGEREARGGGRSGGSGRRSVDERGGRAEACG
eukprot:3476346-Rhodomonas_salina.4